MPKVVVLLTAFQREAILLGVPLETYLRGVAARAGAAGDQGSLVIDARYPAVSEASLARLLQASSGALTTSNGRLVAVLDPDGGEALRDPGGQRHLVEHDEALEVDDGWELIATERAIHRRRCESWARAGVRLVDPERLWVGADVVLEPGATVWPDVVLRGHTVIRAGAVVFERCSLSNTEVQRGASVLPGCVCDGAFVGAESSVGPMAHLRTGTRLEGNNRVGNFVEVKKTTLHKGAKASHLTYLGDASIGEGANVGAGTITCNYDGYGKHRTEVGAGAFIGSNTSLVAPVRVGAGAIVGAGSVITRPVPADALTVERSPQRILEGRAPAIRHRNAGLAGKKP
jgi:UDP-N-acetylglucosamine diphosphorylase/glucosamine-1-phosphate N-acetyltransferase